jgi:hypothetical protein
METQFKIEKGIEFNPPKTNTKYPFGQMEVGDSFIAGEYTRNSMSKFGSSARNYAKKAKNNFKFATRKENDMVRIFRIK